MERKTPKWKDPGIISVGILVLVAGTVLIWWPTDTYVMGISLAGWLMFFSYFAWFAIAVVYVLWIEHLEAKQKEETLTSDDEERRA